MSSVVLLRAVNVGTTNRCRTVEIAKQLEKFGTVNIGAVGTFVVRKDVKEAVLRIAVVKALPFKCEIMIVPGRDLITLAARDPFARQPGGPDIVRFLMVLANTVPKPPGLPLLLPAESEWGLKIIGIEKQFVLGMYRRQMKAVSYLGKFEKQLGVPATTRSWNTIQKIVQVLETS